jgi:hypothetical protein
LKSDLNGIEWNPSDEEISSGSAAAAARATAYATEQEQALETDCGQLAKIFKDRCKKLSGKSRDSFIKKYIKRNFTQEISVRQVNDTCSNIGEVIIDIIIAIPQLISRSVTGPLDDALEAAGGLGNLLDELAQKTQDALDICDAIKAINDKGTKLDEKYNTWGKDRNGKEMKVLRVNGECGNLLAVINDILRIVPIMVLYIKEVPGLLSAKWEAAQNAMCNTIATPLTEHINDDKKYTYDERNRPLDLYGGKSVKWMMDNNMCENIPTILFMLIEIQTQRLKAALCAVVAKPIDDQIDHSSWSKGERTRNYPESNWGNLTDALKESGFTSDKHDMGGGRYGKDRGGNSKRGFSINDFRGLPPDGTDKGPGPDTCDNIGPIVLIMLAIYMDRGIAEGKKLVCAMVSGWNTINWEQEKLPGLGSFGFKNEWLTIPDATDGDTTNAGVVLEEDCSNLPAYISSLLNLIPGLLEKLIKIAVDKAMEVITGPLCTAVTTLLEGDVDGANPLEISPHPGDLGLLDGKVRGELDKVTYKDPTKKDPKWKVEGMNGNCGNLVEFVIQLLKRVGNYITELPEIIAALVMEEINVILSEVTNFFTETIPNVVGKIPGVDFVKKKAKEVDNKAVNETEV